MRGDHNASAVADIVTRWAWQSPTFSNLVIKAIQSGLQTCSFAKVEGFWVVLKAFLGIEDTYQSKRIEGMCCKRIVIEVGFTARFDKQLFL